MTRLMPKESADAHPPLGHSPMCNIASGWEHRAAHTVQGGPFWTAKDVSHRAKKKTPKLPIPRRNCGEEMAHASLTIKHGGREQTGQSNILSMHTREGSSRQQSPMVCASLSPLFGGLVYQASPSPSVFLCILSFSITALASLQGVHPHPNPLSPPDMLADETSGSLSLYRNFLFPLFQNISMAMLLPSELPASEQHTFFLVTVILPTRTDP